MYDLMRIRYVTEHYEDLKGLSLLPMSLFFLALVAYDRRWIGPPSWLAHGPLPALTGFVIAMVLMGIINVLYDRAFGLIVPSKHKRSESGKHEHWIWGGVYGLVAMLNSMRPEMSLLALGVSVCVFSSWWHRREAKHLLAFGVLIAGMSFAPLLDGALRMLYSSGTTWDITVNLVIAAGLLVIGTIDHLTLVRTLGPIRQEEESRA